MQTVMWNIHYCHQGLVVCLQNELSACRTHMHGIFSKPTPRWVPFLFSLRIPFLAIHHATACITYRLNKVLDHCDIERNDVLFWFCIFICIFICISICICRHWMKVSNWPKYIAFTWKWLIYYNQDVQICFLVRNSVQSLVSNLKVSFPSFLHKKFWLF